MTHSPELTQAGFEALQRQLAREQQRLDEARRVVQEQMEANENESLGLEAAQRDLMTTLQRIAELEDTLARAVIVRDAPANRAVVGALVTLLDEGQGRELELHLVSPLEAAAVIGERPRVSTESPVGRALLGREVGERFVVDLGKRQVTYRVQRIRPA
ncbi:GreA/GreB family elongation factor [Deinococcus hohokamensis]|uniref:GreA/GreB family elongation factor n=1 Tax=Deinococcus hohokamensis TaxID=309883 RepID=A0ABV9I7W5_9DEIO